MADKKISELDAITGADTASDDFFIVVDTSGSATKKISRAELNNAIEQDVLAQVDITSANIDGGTIDNTPIGATTAAAGTFTDLTATGTVSLSGVLSNIVEDTTPQLGGNLDTNGNDITFGDNDKAIFGAGSDMSLFHNGNNAFLDNDTGTLFIQTNGFSVKNAAGTESMMLGAADGAVTLYHNNVAKLATTTGGIDVQGSVTADGLTLGDNDKAIFGAGSDLQIYHDGLNSYIKEAGTGDLIIGGSNYGTRIQDADSNDLLVANPSSVSLLHNGSEKLETTSGGIDVTGTVTASSFDTTGGVFLGSTNTYIYEGAANVLNIRVGADGPYAEFADAGSSVLEFGNASSDLALTSSGTERMRLISNGNVGIGTSSPSANLHVSGSGARKIDITDTGGANTRISTANNKSYVGSTTSHPLLFITNDVERMRLDNSGRLGLGTTAPDSALHVQRSDFATLKLEQTNTTGTQISDIVGEQNGTQKWRLGKLSSSSDDFMVHVGTNERLRIDSNGNVYAKAEGGSGTNVDLRQGSSKAWINYQQASTFSTRDSFNISSVSDDGSGLADTNYTASFANSGYAANGGSGRQSSTSTTAYWTFPVRSAPVYTTNSTSWTSGYSIGTSSGLNNLDCFINIVNIHGDLA